MNLDTVLFFWAIFGLVLVFYMVQHLLCNVIYGAIRNLYGYYVVNLLTFVCKYFCAIFKQ